MAVIYSEQVLDHFKQPRNAGSFASGEPNIGRAYLSVPKHHVILQLQIKAAAELILAARFKAYGCGATIAAGSWVSAWLQNKTIAEARALHNSDIIRALALPPEKVYCAVLAQNAVQHAINDYLVQND